MKNLIVAATMALGLSSTALATSTYSCQVVEANGTNYSFQFSASRTAGETLVGGRILKSIPGPGAQLETIEFSPDQIVQYWNDGGKFYVAISDENYDFIQYKIITEAEEIDTLAPGNYQGTAFIKASGKAWASEARAQCQVSG